MSVQEVDECTFLCGGEHCPDAYPFHVVVGVDTDLPGVLRGLEGDSLTSLRKSASSAVAMIAEASSTQVCSHMYATRKEAPTVMTPLGLGIFSLRQV